MQIKRNINWFHLILSIVVVELIGSLSGLLAGNIKSIYTSLKLPPLSPPAAVFGPVWIILYLLIGVAGYLVIKDTTSRTQKTINLSLFGSQLLLNFIWSIVFFGGNSYWLDHHYSAWFGCPCLHTCLSQCEQTGSLPVCAILCLDFIRYLFDVRSGDDELVACWPIF